MGKTLIDLTPFVQAAILFCMAGLSVFAIPWLRSILKAETFDTLLRCVEFAVKAAEQVGQTWKGSQKKKYVLDFLASKGYKIDDAEIDALIEASVLELHNRLYNYSDDDDDDGEDLPY